MNKTFRPFEPEQVLLFPPALEDWLPDGHLARFVADLTAQLDLSKIFAYYERESRGYPPYHPQMMTRILLYGYCRGLFSSRRIAARLQDDVGFRFLAASNEPDFRTISDFRKIHKATLEGFFLQVLKICKKAGLIKLGHVSIDGTKIKANASKHSAMSYGRMSEEEKRLREEVRELLGRADKVDEEEDALYGKDKRGDELPEELRHRKTRLAKIREAKAALEAEAKAEADRIREADTAERARREKEGLPQKSGKKPDPPTVPDEKAQRNFTDPESRIMKSSDKAFIQGYNCQVVVDESSQIVVAKEVTSQAADAPHFAEMLEQTRENTGEVPKKATADAGYFSEANVGIAQEQGIDPYISPERQKHTDEKTAAPRGRPPTNLSVKERMLRKLRTKAGRAIYALRKQIVEPVFGQIKFGRGFCQFLLRGLEKVRLEWSLICTTHNMLKLWRSGYKLAMA